MNALKCRTLGAMNSCYILWTDLAWRHDQWQRTKLNSRLTIFHTGRNDHFSPLPRGKYYNVHACFPCKNGLWLSTEGVLDLSNSAVSEKAPQVFDLCAQ